MKTFWWWGDFYFGELLNSRAKINPNSTSPQEEGIDSLICCPSVGCRKGVHIASREAEVQYQELQWCWTEAEPDFKNTSGQGMYCACHSEPGGTAAF